MWGFMVKFLRTELVNCLHRGVFGYVAVYIERIFFQRGFLLCCAKDVGKSLVQKATNVE